jgi:hypothetical protein
MQGDEMSMNEEPGQNDQTGSEEPGTGQSRAREQAARARELGERWVGQLQEMIDQAGRQAGPVLRDVAAKAAELAAVAAQNAGPVAHKAADVTEHVGDRVAARSKDLASDLRRAADTARAQQAQEQAGPENGSGSGDAGSMPGGAA